MNSRQQSGLVRCLWMALLFLLIQVPPVMLSLRQTGGGAALGAGLYLLGLALVALIAWWIYRRWRPVQRPRWQWRQAVDWIGGGYLAIIAVQVALGQLNQAIYHQTQTANNQSLTRLMGHDPVLITAMAVGMVCLSPVAEELIFRGVLMNMFFKPDQLWTPVIVSGLLFSAGHASTNPISFLIYGMMGCILAYVYRKTGNLGYAIGLHGLNNLVATAVMVAGVLS